MRIIGDTIHFKSNPFFYFKEITNQKPNTIRRLTDMEKIDMMFVDTICIHHSIYGYYFQRKLKDISYFEDIVIFSW